MRKFRSSTVILGGMGVLAATLTACGSEPDRRCMDPVSRKQLPNYECKSSGGHTTRGTYYYGGSVDADGRISGGSTNKSAVDTGGFGCSKSSGG